MGLSPPQCGKSWICQYTLKIIFNTSALLHNLLLSTFNKLQRVLFLKLKKTSMKVFAQPSRVFCSSHTMVSDWRKPVRLCPLWPSFWFFLRDFVYISYLEEASPCIALCEQKRNLDMYIHIAFPYCGRWICVWQTSSWKEHESRYVPIAFVLSTNTVPVSLDSRKDL